MSKKETIIWALDPTQELPNSKQLVQLLQLWSKRLEAPIQPVCIFSRTLFSMPVDLPFPWLDQLPEVANELTIKYLNRLDANEFLPPKLLYISSNSHRQAAITVADYALQNKAQLIVVNSGVDSKWNLFSRFGFTETIITTSRIPVLAINQNTLLTPAIRTVLFPTDFSRESKVAFLNLQPWLKRHESEIIIYNEVETPNLNYSVFDGAWMNINIEELISEIETARLKMSKEWKDALKTLKIKGSVAVERQQKGLEADIIAYAQRMHVDLITLVNHSGELKQTLLGSVAREILTQATCPVLIFHDPILKYKKLMKEGEEHEIPEKPLNPAEWNL
jgi:nucleotide-binding universal stress UspA family protein